MSSPANQFKHPSRLKSYIDAGWPAIPIQPGDKRPAYVIESDDPDAIAWGNQYTWKYRGAPTWHRDGVLTPEVIESCEKVGCGTGILDQQGFGGIDLDIVDPTVIGSVRVWLMEQPELGPDMVWRVGRPPKMLIPIRLTDGGSVPRKQVPLDGPKAPLDKRGHPEWRIEFPWQYVIDGVHKSTRDPYRLYGGTNAAPVAGPPELSLPQFNLTTKQFLDLRSRLFEWMTTNDYLKQDSALAASTKIVTQPSSHDNDAQFTEKLTRDLLDLIPNTYDDRHLWIGMAHRVRDAELSSGNPGWGADLFVEWCRKWKGGAVDDEKNERAYTTLNDDNRHATRGGLINEAIKASGGAAVNAVLAPHKGSHAATAFANAPEVDPQYLDEPNPFPVSGTTPKGQPVTISAQPEGMDLDALDPDDEPIIFYDERRYLLEGEITLLFSKPGVGKSTWLLNYLLAGTLNRDLYGKWILPEFRSLYISAEDNRKIVRARMRGWLRRAIPNFNGKGAPHPATKDLMDRVKFYLRGHPEFEKLRLSTPDGEINEHAFTWIERQIALTHASVIVLDTLAALFGASETDPTAQAAILTRLGTISARHKVAFVIVHHERKTAPGTQETDPNDAARGTTAIIGAVRRSLRIQVMTEEEARRVGIPEGEHWRYFSIVEGKSNYTPKASRLEWYQLHSEDLDNARPPHPATNVGVVLPWTHPGAILQNDLRYRIIEAIDRRAPNGDMTDSYPAGARTEDIEDLAEDVKAPVTEVKEVRKMLHDEGYIEKADGRKTPDRQKRQGLRVTPKGHAWIAETKSIIAKSAAARAENDANGSVFDGE